MKKYRITSIPKTLPKAQVGEEVEVTGLDPNQSAWSNINYPNFNLEQPIEYNVGPQQESRTFVDPVAWPYGKTIPGGTETYSFPKFNLNPFTRGYKDGYSPTMQKALGLYTGPEMEDVTIDYPEQFIPDYYAPYTQTGEPLSCLEGQIAYKGQCLSEESYRQIMFREGWDLETNKIRKDLLSEEEIERKIKEEREKKLQNEYKYNVKINTPIKGYRSKKDKLEPYRVKENVPEEEYKKQIENDKLLNSFYINAKKNKDDGTYNIEYYPRSVINNLIYNHGTNVDNFVKWHGFDKEQMANDPFFMTEYIRWFKDYGKRGNKFMEDLIEKGYTVDQAIDKLIRDKQFGTALGLGNLFGAKAKLLENELYGSKYYQDTKLDDVLEFIRTDPARPIPGSITTGKDGKKTCQCRYPNGDITTIEVDKNGRCPCADLGSQVYEMNFAVDPNRFSEGAPELSTISAYDSLQLAKNKNKAAIDRIREIDAKIAAMDERITPNKYAGQIINLSGEDKSKAPQMGDFLLKQQLQEERDKLIKDNKLDLDPKDQWNQVFKKEYDIENAYNQLRQLNTKLTSNKLEDYKNLNLKNFVQGNPEILDEQVKLEIQKSKIEDVINRYNKLDEYYNKGQHDRDNLEYELKYINENIGERSWSKIDWDLTDERSYKNDKNLSNKYKQIYKDVEEKLSQAKDYLERAQIWQDFIKNDFPKLKADYLKNNNLEDTEYDNASKLGKYANQDYIGDEDNPYLHKITDISGNAYLTDRDYINSYLDGIYNQVRQYYGEDSDKYRELEKLDYRKTNDLDFKFAIEDQTGDINLYFKELKKYYEELPERAQQEAKYEFEQNLKNRLENQSFAEGFANTFLNLVTNPIDWFGNFGSLDNTAPWAHYDDKNYRQYWQSLLPKYAQYNDAYNIYEGEGLAETLARDYRNQYTSAPGEFSGLFNPFNLGVNAFKGAGNLGINLEENPENVGFWDYATPFMDLGFAIMAGGGKGLQKAFSSSPIAQATAKTPKLLKPFKNLASNLVTPGGVLATYFAYEGLQPDPRSETGESYYEYQGKEIFEKLKQGKVAELFNDPEVGGYALQLLIGAHVIQNSYGAGKTFVKDVFNKSEPIQNQINNPGSEVTIDLINDIKKSGLISETIPNEVLIEYPNLLNLAIRQGIKSQRTVTRNVFPRNIEGLSDIEAAFNMGTTQRKDYTYFNKGGLEYIPKDLQALYGIKGGINPEKPIHPSYGTFAVESRYPFDYEGDAATLFERYKRMPIIKASEKSNIPHRDFYKSGNIIEGVYGEPNYTAVIGKLGEQSLDPVKLVTDPKATATYKSARELQETLDLLETAKDKTFVEDVYKRKFKSLESAKEWLKHELRKNTRKLIQYRMGQKKMGPFKTYHFSPLTQKIKIPKKQFGGRVERSKDEDGDYYKKGGFVELKLTPKQIREYVNDGYIVEEL